MNAARDEIAVTIHSLSDDVGELRARVEAIERALRSGERISSAEPEAAGESVLFAGDTAEVVGLVGRTLVILGGAFLLRAVSSAALLPHASGPLLGLLYALAWLFKADRTPGAEQKHSSFFYGLAGVGIAFPLLWESAARFRIVPGSFAAPALVLFVIFGLLVSRRRDLRVLAWITTGAGLVTAAALLFATHEFVLFTGALVAVAVVVEAFELTERWPELRWVPAVVVDVTLLLLALLVSQPRMSAELAAALPAGGVITVSLLAPVVYLSSVATATLALRRSISPFELAQVCASLLCGIGTALVAISFLGGDSRGIAIAVSLIGLACYGVAFVSIDAAEHPRRNFYAYTTFAGILVGAGTMLLLPAASLAAVWVALAASGVTLGIGYRRNTLRLHGALYLAAAAFPSGLAAISLHGLLGRSDVIVPQVPMLAWLVLVAGAACYAALLVRREPESHWAEFVPRFAIAAVVTCGTAGLAAPIIAGVVLRLAHGLEPAALLASSRTGVLAVLAVTLAWAGSRWSLRELAWLVYPLMVAGGVRMLLEDLRYGAPIHLFVAFGFYGGALILTSRLLHRRR